MKIYVASSWRNGRQPYLVEELRARGHEVYDFRHPAQGDDGFGWRQLGMGDHQGWTGPLLRVALNHPIAQKAFNADAGALARADCCVLLYPCGNDAHMEAGWAKGAGKLLVILYADGIADPGLMDLYADRICVNDGELFEWLDSRLPRGAR